MAGHERRESVRVGISSLPALFESGNLKSQGEILSLSKKGMFLRCMELPEVSAEVHVTFKTREHGKIQVVGRVTWNTNQLASTAYRNPGFGMRFTGWSESYHDFYERALFTPRDPGATD